MSAIFIDGQLAHYEVIGRGKPVLFLHGWVGSWRYWVPTMQTISSTNRAYALDLWGFGDSAKNNRYSINDQIALVRDFIEKIGLSRVAIVGHNLGAIVAYEFARRNPELVEKILSISLPLSFELLNTRLLLGDHIGLVDKLLGKGIETEAVRSDESKNDPIAIQTTVSELETTNHLEMIASFEKTSLFVFGQNDSVVRVPSLEIIQSLRSNIHSIIFEESGHFPMLDESSKFSRLLSEFLELGEDDSPRNLQIKEKWQRRVR
ncbi:MAG: alpha/beta hydrolase [Anaerolineaceae bacterium]|nr:alpha/beta hydrolase [Anaerolineaceae bacterium]